MDAAYQSRRSPYDAAQARLRLCRRDLQRVRADVAVISHHLEQIRPGEDAMLCLRLNEVLLEHMDALRRLEAEERAQLDCLQALALDAVEITVESEEAA